MDGPAARSEIVPRRLLRTPAAKAKFDRAAKRAKAWAKRRQDFDQWVLIETERDDLLGLTRKFYFNVDTQTYRIDTIPDVKPLLEQNEREYNASGSTHGKDMVKVAALPMNLLFQNTDWRTAYREKDDKWINRRLNDPDYRKLRTHKGTL